MNTNAYCEALGIDVPSLEAIADHPEANTFSRLLVALLERGAPMTLKEVAARFESAGLGDADAALRSLSRCRPARPPVYRDGDLYALDAHDDGLDLWVFRLGLRPPRFAAPRPEPPAPTPPPGLEVSLSTAEIEEAFRGAYLASWSAQRLALAVLDAHGGRLHGADVVETLNRWTRHHALRLESAAFWRAGAIAVTADGTWSVVPTHPALRATRRAVRERIQTERRHRAAGFMDAEALRAHQQRVDEKRAAHGAALARLRRVLVAAFPPDAPVAVTLLDMAERRIDTFTAGELEAARARLSEYDVIGALDVRRLLRALAFDPGPRRLAELGPAQKTMQLNQRGRTLRITPELLVQGCCGVARPFGDPERMRAYLERGEATRLRRRLEADAKSLYAIYEYGRLHHFVRLRWGFLDERLLAPWVHPDEPGLYELMRGAHADGHPLEVVVGSAPGWDDPWARAVACASVRDPGGYGFLLVGESGWVLDKRDVQRARLAGHGATEGIDGARMRPGRAPSR
ncbi:MAG TPA: hypothetical protein VFQ38_24825 [Longimicrobiales bacterium]|nr:hypothetical protein [Longimicrobiales bacterium]